MLLYVFVFRRVFDVPIQRYHDYLLCGLLPWSFLTVALSRSTASVSGEGDLLRKAPFPAELLPLSGVAAHAIDLVCTIGLFVAWLTVTGEMHWTTLPLVIFPTAAVVLLVMALAMLLALIDVHTHDLRYLLGNLLTVWFFLIPIVYRPNMAPRSVHFLRTIDPMNLIVGQMRAILFTGRIERPAQLVLMLAACLALFGVSLAFFRTRAVNLAKDV
jgi:ABC-type polysaccharide/polyol phosphate export permease